jgi:hypothetical protein
MWTEVVSLWSGQTVLHRVEGTNGRFASNAFFMNILEITPLVMIVMITLPRFNTQVAQLIWVRSIGRSGHPDSQYAGWVFTECDGLAPLSSST